MQHRKKGRRVTMAYNCPICGKALVYVHEDRIDSRLFYTGWRCDTCGYSVGKEENDDC